MRIVFLFIFLSLYCNAIQSQNYNLHNDSVKQDKVKCELITQLDSLNYAFGLLEGDSIRHLYNLQTNTTGESFFAIIAGMDSSLLISQDEMYMKGVKVGYFLNEQTHRGLMGDSTIIFKQELVETGLIDALNNSYYLMNPQEAKEFMIRTMSKSNQSLDNDKDEITIRILNYAYGITLGTTIKDNYIKGDSITAKTNSFIAGLKVTTPNINSKFPQLFNLGKEIGISLKFQSQFGFGNYEALKFNFKLIKDGYLDGLTGRVCSGCMTIPEARTYFDKTIQ